MRDPGDGSVITATNISIITYAGDGLWSPPRRHLQPAALPAGRAEVVPQGAGTGHARRGRRALDAARTVAASSERQTQTGHRRQRLFGFARHPPVGRRRRRSAGHGAPERQHPRHRRPSRSPASTATSSTPPRCARRWTASTTCTTASSTPAPGCVTRRRCFAPTSKACATSSMSPSRNPSLRRFIFTSTYATVGRRHGHVATEDDVIGSARIDSLRPIPGAGRESGDAVRGRGRPARRRDVRLDDLRQRRLGPHPARRLHRRRGLRQAAVLMNGIQLEVVGVDDAARAMILAAEHGRIGERYLISEKMIAMKDVVRIAAEEAGVPPPATLDLGARAVRAGRAGQPEGPAHRQRRRTQPQIGADDARRSRRRSQQGASANWAGSRARSRNRSARPPGSGPRCAPPGSKSSPATQPE